MSASSGRTRAGCCCALACVASLLLAGAAPARASSAAVRVVVFFPRGALGADCAAVAPRARTVAPPAVLTGAMRALVAGPTQRERALGYRGWFSTRTANAIRRVTIRAAVARVDFRGSLRRLIPGASSSCGSTLLLAQLDRTALQFPSVRRAVYSLDGNVAAFYEWLQRVPPAVSSRCAWMPELAARAIVPPPPFRARVVSVRRWPLPPEEPAGRGPLYKRLYLVTFRVLHGNVVLPTGVRVSQFAYVERGTLDSPWCFTKGGSGP